MNNKKPLVITFWKKGSGNYMAHGAGLTQEQVDQLQQLKAGDRFILWANKKTNDATPDLSLKIFKNLDHVESNDEIV